MKKILATLLAATTVLSAAAVSANAMNSYNEEWLSDNYPETVIDVIGDSEGVNPYVPLAYEDENAYVSLRVSWEDTKFTFDFGETWDDNELKYVNMPGWDRDTMEVTVANRSNCPVSASVEFEKAWGAYLDGVTASFETDTVNLESAIDGDEKVFVFKLSVGGVPGAYFKNESLGTITVSVGAPVVAEPEPEPEPEPNTDPTPNTDPQTQPEEGEHVHNYQYDQFGRRVCVECGEVEHNICYDSDEDGLCDECGLERDFCPDCLCDIEHCCCY